MSRDLTGVLQAERATDRVDAGVRVRHGTNDVSYVDRATNVSVAGLCIDTNRVYPVGTRLVLYLEFPGRTIRHDGEVAWAIKVPDHMRDAMVCGMGISFVEPDPAWASFFRSWKLSQIE